MNNLNLIPLREEELENINGGLFPLVVAGVVISAKAAGWIAAGTLAAGVFAAGVYVGYKEAAE